MLMQNLAVEWSGLAESNLAAMLVGICLLIFGRQLFWLAVVAVGFYTGWKFSQEFLGEQSPVIVWAISLLFGLASGLLAKLVQKVAFAAAGFAVGGYFISNTLREWEIVGTQHEWLVFLIGGAVGALLVASFFEVGLMAVSALLGAGLLVEQLGLALELKTAALLTLAIAGFLVQAGLLRKFFPAKEERKLKS